MLGKLIKYDLLADWKHYMVIYASTLLLSVMTYFLERDMTAVQNNIFLLIADHIVSAMLVFTAFATVVMVFVLAVTRFYKNIVRDEGYLMHTLPVHTWQLIASKLITVYVWFAAALAVICVSTGILMGDPFWLFNIFDEYREAVNGLGERAADIVYEVNTFLGYFVGSVALMPFFFMSHIYFSLALGNLSNGHKLGIAVVMFFAINIAEQFIVTIIMAVCASELITMESVPDSTMLEFMDNSMTASMIVAIVLSVGMIIAAERIFAKKLNLE